ncbi:MAG: hypothetical protein JW910_21135, partial [Anaerolineae bacterium]|nr:hypothetical protein [Anaerolineae bacterium]
MSRKTIVLAILVVLLTLAAALPGAAQEGPALPGEVVITDLGAPRGLAFDADGNLFVADAGTGGDVQAVMPGPEGEATVGMGMSGRIVSVAPDGTAADAV